MADHPVIPSGVKGLIERLLKLASDRFMALSDEHRRDLREAAAALESLSGELDSHKALTGLLQEQLVHDQQRAAAAEKERDELRDVIENLVLLRDLQHTLPDDPTTWTADNLGIFNYLAVRQPIT